jgi:hypothetical protein
MLDNVLSNNFHIFFSNDFLYEETKITFEKYFHSNQNNFENIIDYINSTILEHTIPSFDLEVTDEQIVKGGETRTFSGSLNYLDQIDKTIEMTFGIKNSYFNYLVLLKQASIYWNRKKLKNISNPFLGDIHLHIKDDYGNLISYFRMEQIQFQSIGPLTFSKTDRSYQKKEFICKFNFNKLDWSIANLDTLNYTREEFKY